MTSTFAENTIVSGGSDRLCLVFADGGEHDCEVVYELGGGSPDDREWWLLEVVSWIVERGAAQDVEFIRSSDDDTIRIEFRFDSIAACRRFRERGSHEIVVDGERVVDARIVSRCEPSA